MTLRKNSFKASLLAILAILAEVIATAGEIVTIKEKHSADPGGYVDGKHGKALWLATATNNYLEYPLLFHSKQAAAGTVSLWFRMSGPKAYWPGNVKILSMSDGKNEMNMWIAQTDENDRSRVFLQPSTNVGKGSAVELAAVRDWHHFAFVWDASGGVFHLDGVALPGTASLRLDSQTSVLRLCGSNQRPVFFDDLVVLDRRLSEQELKELAAAPWTAGAGTVLHLPFDGQLDGQSHIESDGDHVRGFLNTPNPLTTFWMDEPMLQTVNAVNFTAQPVELMLRGRMRDVNRKELWKEEKPLVLKPGGAMSLTVTMEPGGAKGLFICDLSLADTAGKVWETRVTAGRAAFRQFPKADSPAGFLVGDGFDPPPFEGWTMLYLSWSDIEVQPGVYDFESMDMLVSDLVRTGRKPIFHLYTTPRWYSQKAAAEGARPDKLSRDRLYPDEDQMDGLRRFVKTMGERYQGRVNHYEMQSESCHLPAEVVGRVCAAAAEELHRVDIKIQVGVDIGTGNEQWKRTVAKLTAGKLDYYTCHPYGFTTKNYWRNYDEKELLKLRQLLREEGASDRMAASEVHGYSLRYCAYDQEGFPLSEEELVERGIWQRELAQSSYLQKTWTSPGPPPGPRTSAGVASRCLILCAAGGCEYFIWWSLFDSDPIIELPFTPTMKSVGFTNACGYMATHRYVKRLPAAAGTKLYLFQNKVDGCYLLAGWVDDGKAAAFIETDEPGFAPLDLWGNPVACARNGRLVELPLDMTPVFVPGLKLEPLPGKTPTSLALSGGPFLPGGKALVKAEFKNPFNRSVTGRLRLANAERRVELQALDELTIELSTDVPAAGMLEASFLPDSPEDGAFRATASANIRPIIDAVQTPSGFKVDGDLAEWGAPVNFPVKLDSAANLVEGVPFSKAGEGLAPWVNWNGPKDLSCRATVASDGKRLCVAVRVWDDRRMVPDSLPPSKKSDYVEIYFDQRHQNSRGQPLRGQERPPRLVVAAPGADGDATAWMATPPLWPLYASVAAKILPDGYSVEIAIPYSTWFPDMAKDPAGWLGLDIRVNDFDPEESFQGNAALSWANTSNPNDPATLGRLFLKDGGKSK